MVLPKTATQPPKKQKLDANLILGQLAAMRKRFPHLDEVAPQRPVENVRTRSTDGFPLQTAEDLEWVAVIDGFESLAHAKSANLFGAHVTDAGGRPVARHAAF